MPILESATSAAAAFATFCTLAMGGVADTSLRLLNKGQGLLAQAGFSTEAQYGVAGFAAAACVFLGKMVIGYHERMLTDRDRQITELHQRVKDLEAIRDSQSQAVLKAGLAGLDTSPDNRP